MEILLNEIERLSSYDELHYKVCTACGNYKHASEYNKFKTCSKCREYNKLKYKRGSYTHYHDNLPYLKYNCSICKTGKYKVANDLKYDEKLNKI